VESWNVRGAQRLDGALRPPGDKSIAHRAVLLAALARGRCRLEGLPDGDDVRRTLRAVQALGVRAELQDDVWRLDGVGPRGLCAARHPIDCGNSGTTMRLLAGVLAAQPFSTLLVGDASLSRRPMGRIAAPLRRMGAHVECLGPDERPPLRLGGGPGRLRGTTHRLAVDSAQVRSALLLAGLLATGPTSIEPTGASRDHTERLLQARGVHLVADTGGLWLHPTRPHGWTGFDARIPGDVSSAAFAVALAAATPGSRLHVLGVGLNPGRSRYLEVLRAAGARIAVLQRGLEQGEPWGDLRVEGGALSGWSLRGPDVVRCLDEIPAICAAAAVAGCGARLRDAAELRVKESDRIAGLAALLRAFGARVEELPDGLRLAAGTRLRAARFASRGDHRLAMAAAVLALASPGTSRVDDTACVRTSYPGFTADFGRLAVPPARHHVATRG
jgi:3-phosphoshikimate 1-carboxyvinyltransferase